MQTVATHIIVYHIVATHITVFTLLPLIIITVYHTFATHITVFDTVVSRTAVCYLSHHCFSHCWLRLQESRPPSALQASNRSLAATNRPSTANARWTGMKVLPLPIVLPLLVLSLLLPLLLLPLAAV